MHLIIVSMLLGGLATLLAYSLKTITGRVESIIFHNAESRHLLLLILPMCGLIAIFFIRKLFFKNKPNKGIAEIYEVMGNRRTVFPIQRIASHCINGFLTVIFGGSTGVEVSTVVATAALGEKTGLKTNGANKYKSLFICAGIAAGIATLFGSYFAGFLFVTEVIVKKLNKNVAIACFCSLLVSMVLNIWVIDNRSPFDFSVYHWKWSALPFMMILSVLTAIAAAYFTKVVIFLKYKWGHIANNWVRIGVGSMIVGLALYIIPSLYGDSYDAINPILKNLHTASGNGLLLLSSVIILKPLIASMTLGAGGDGGVFAPSLITGAFLGMLVAVVCNQYLHTDFYVSNFALMGAAMMLSAAIHAPLTALFLACSLVPNGAYLFAPLLLGSYLSKFVAAKILPYTVYSYAGH